MNKAELISEIAKQTSLTKTDTEKFLNALVSTISSSMKNDEQVQLFGLGTFQDNYPCCKTWSKPNHP